MLSTCADEFRAAIGIAAVIERIDPDENIEGLERFRPCERMGKKDRVPCRNICHRNSLRHPDSDPRFRHIDIVGQRRAAEDLIVDLGDDVRFAPSDFATARAASISILWRCP